MRLSMNIRIKALTTIATMMLLSVSVFAQTETYPQVRIPNTEEPVLNSKIMELQFIINPEITYSPSDQIDN
jgi:hypothetical protein